MHYRKKSSVALLPTLLCLIGMLLIGCDTGPSNPTGQHQKVADDKQVLVMPENVTDIATFDPAIATDIHSVHAIDMVFTGLVGLDDQLNVTGELAQSWSQSSDGLTWTFHLRSDLKFSDGAPLTSADVAYSIDRALQPSVKSTTSPIYLALVLDSDKLISGEIKTIIGDSLLTPDAQTIIIRTSKKTSYFLNTLTYPCSFVVEKRLIDRYGNENFTDHLTEGGGSGPFIVSRYSHSTGITFVPNANYYGAKPQLKKVVFPFYKDFDTIYSAYQTGQVSIVDIPAPRLAEARQKTKEYRSYPVLAIGYLAMNYLVKPFDNIHLRQALALAVNKDLIESQVYEDISIATNHIVPQGMPGYNPNLIGPAGVKGTSGDSNKAKQLLQMGLQEEGWE
jgi:oligopeptide transport system substrate-binding protein